MFYRYLIHIVMILHLNSYRVEIYLNLKLNFKGLSKIWERFFVVFE